VLMTKRTTYSILFPVYAVLFLILSPYNSKSILVRTYEVVEFLYLLTCHRLLTDDDMWQVRTPSGRTVTHEARCQWLNV
jgi:hypothetical protein